MSNSSSGRRLVGGLISLALTVVAALTVIHFAPAIGRSAGERFADRVRKEQGIASPQEKAAARAKVAKSKFVPVVHKKFPRLTAGVPDHRLAKVATDTCDLLDNFAYNAHYDDKARVITRTGLTHGGVAPSRPQVVKVLRLAAATVCPEKTYLVINIR